MDNIILTIFFLRLQTNIPFIDRILEKLSELSGGREEIVLLALFILVLLFLLFIRGRIKKAKQKKALEYHSTHIFKEESFPLRPSNAISSQ